MVFSLGNKVLQASTTAIAKTLQYYYCNLMAPSVNGVCFVGQVPSGC